MSKRELPPDEQQKLDASIESLMDTLAGGPRIRYAGFCDLWAALGIALHLMPAAGNDEFRQAVVATLASQQLLVLGALRRGGGRWCL